MSIAHCPARGEQDAFAQYASAGVPTRESKPHRRLLKSVALVKGSNATVTLSEAPAQAIPVSRPVTLSEAPAQAIPVSRLLLTAISILTIQSGILESSPLSSF